VGIVRLQTERHRVCFCFELFPRDRVSSAPVMLTGMQSVLSTVLPIGNGVETVIHTNGVLIQSAELTSLRRLPSMCQDSSAEHYKLGAIKKFPSDCNVM
jgi:hypothetical protein